MFLQLTTLIVYIAFGVAIGKTYLLFQQYRLKRAQRLKFNKYVHGILNERLGMYPPAETQIPTSSIVRLYFIKTFQIPTHISSPYNIVATVVDINLRHQTPYVRFTPISPQHQAEFPYGITLFITQLR